MTMRPTLAPFQDAPQRRQWLGHRDPVVHTHFARFTTGLSLSILRLDPLNVTSSPNAESAGFRVMWMGFPSASSKISAVAPEFAEPQRPKCRAANFRYCCQS